MVSLSTKNLGDGEKKNGPVSAWAAQQSDRRDPDLATGFQIGTAHGLRRLRLTRAHLLITTLRRRKLGRLLPGNFGVLVGDSSADIALNGTASVSDAAASTALK